MWLQDLSMTFNELISHFAAFGINSAEIAEVVKDLDVNSIDSMEETDKKFRALKDKARKGFRKVAMPLHPDRTDDKDAHGRFNAYNQAMRAIDELEVNTLVSMGLVGGFDDQFDGGADDGSFEEAQDASFRAMAKWYRGPLVPLGWQGNREASEKSPAWENPPTPADPTRTFFGTLPEPEKGQ